MIWRQRQRGCQDWHGGPTTTTQLSAGRQHCNTFATFALCCYKILSVMPNNHLSPCAFRKQAVATHQHKDTVSNGVSLGSISRGGPDSLEDKPQHQLGLIYVHTQVFKHTDQAWPLQRQTSCHWPSQPYTQTHVQHRRLSQAFQRHSIVSHSQIHIHT
jgi:hypothetical protein